MASGVGPAGYNYLPGLKAGADLRTKQYTFVKWDTDPTKVVTCGAGERPCGVLHNAPNTDEPAQVAALDGKFGPLAVDASTILVGSFLKSDANGKGTVTTGDNDVVPAQAFEASSAAKEINVQYLPGAPRY